MRRLHTVYALLTGLLVGCSGVEPNHFRLDMVLDKTTVASTDSVSLTLTLVNLSTQTVKVPDPLSYFCTDVFQVVDQQGHQVDTDGEFCAELLSSYLPPPVDLRPGESIVITGRWRPGTSRMGVQQLPPGVYLIRGRAAADNRVVYSVFESVTLQP